MTDLEKWLKPKDVKREMDIKEMAKAYASGKTVTQISIDFGYTTSTIRYVLRHYIPTIEEIAIFKMKFAAKQLRNKKYKG